jgi:predicted RNA-binding Zn-ribbon protein involved in translation (DUF1610 family)
VSVEHAHLGECHACGYDLAGRSVGDSCPECGAVVIANPFRSGWRDAKVRRRFLRGSRCMVAATALIGVGIGGGVLLIMLTPLDQYPVTMPIFSAVMFSGIAVLAASAVLLAFVWRAIGAVRGLVMAIALLLASLGGAFVAPLLGIAPTIEHMGACWAILGAAIAAAPIYLARSSGRAMRFSWLPFASSGALVAVAIMALTFSSWGWPYEEMVTALVMTSQFGTAAAFCFLQRAITVGLHAPREAEHAQGSKHA